MKNLGVQQPLYQTYHDIVSQIQRLASEASEPVPLDFEAVTEKIIRQHSENSLVKWSFYLIFDMHKGEIVWQYGMDAVLGIAREGSWTYQFLQKLHPSYIPMFQAWTEAAGKVWNHSNQFPTGNYVYHMGTPLLCEDGQYHWFVQHIFSLQTDSMGRYISYIIFSNYAGRWYEANRPPFLPYITNNNRPDKEGSDIVYRAIAPMVKMSFSPKEQSIVEWYMKGKPEQGNPGIARNTLHEHNGNILAKMQSLLLTNFKSAREASVFIRDSKLWPEEKI